MSELETTLAASAAGLATQAARLRLTAENIANVDTPGYRRKVMSFEQSFASPGAGGVVTAGRVRLDQTPPERVLDPGHPLADAEGYYEGSNVNLMIEIADAREAQRSYEANLRMFDQARQMASSVLELLRR
jgi:flagellar basal-body rod protein FlgC